MDTLDRFEAWLYDETAYDQNPGVCEHGIPEGEFCSVCDDA